MSNIPDQDKKDVIVDDFDEMFSRDFENDFNDEGDFQSNAKIPKGREAVSFFTGNFIEGISGQLTDSNAQRRIIESALPSGYTTAFDMVRETSSTVNDVKQQITEEVKPLVDRGKRLTSSILPKLESKIPDKYLDKIKKWSQDREEEYRAKSQDEYNREDLANALDGIFGAYITKQEEQHEERIERDELREAITTVQQNKIADRQINLLAGIREDTSSLRSYQDQVTIQFQRKLIDLQYWNLITARKSLNVHEQHLSMQTKANEVLVKNTGLPDFVKVQNSELVERNLKEAFIGRVTEPLSRNFSTIGRRIVERTMPKMKELTQQLGVRMLTAQDMINNASAADSLSNRDKAGLATQGAGGMAAHIVSPWLAKFLRPHLQNNETVSTLSDTFTNMSENLPRYYQELIRNSGTSGSTLLDIIRDFGDFESDRHNKSSVVQTSAINELDKQALFTLQTRRTITDVIPGWLGRVHNEIRMLRTGSESEPDRFDFSTMKFETKQTIKERFAKRVLGDRNIAQIHERTYAMVNNLDDEGELSPDAQRALQEHINMLAYDESKRFSIADLADNASNIPGKAGEEIAEFFKRKTGLTSEQLKNKDFMSRMKIEGSQNKDFQRMSKLANEGMEDIRLRTNSRSIQQAVIDMAKIGQLDIAEELGLATRDEREGNSVVRYDHGRIQQAVNEYEDRLHRSGDETPEQTAARLKFIRSGGAVGPRQSYDGYHNSDGEWIWFDETRNKRKVADWSVEARLGRQVDKLKTKVKSKLKRRRNDGLTDQESEEVDSIVDELKDSLTDKMEILKSLYNKGIISSNIFKAAQKRLNRIGKSKTRSSDTEEEIVTEIPTDPNAPKPDTDLSETIREITEEIQATEEAKVDDSSDKPKDKPKVDVRAAMQARSRDIANRARSMVGSVTPVITPVVQEAPQPKDEVNANEVDPGKAIVERTLTSRFRSNKGVNDNLFVKHMDRIVSAIESNNQDEGFELLGTQLSALIEAVGNIGSVEGGSPKGPGLVRRGLRAGKAGLKGLWNYHVWTYKKLWQGTKFLAKAPLKLVDGVKEAFSLGKYSEDYGSKMVGAKKFDIDRDKDLKQDLYLPDQKEPVILAKYFVPTTHDESKARLDAGMTIKYISFALDKDGNEDRTKKKFIKALGDIQGPIYEVNEGVSKLIVSKDDLHKLMLSNGKPAKSLFSKTIKWSLLGIAGVLGAGLATAILPPALMAGATGWLMYKGAQGAKKAISWMLNFTPDIYVGEEVNPRLIGRILRSGGYVDKGTGKVIRNINDITGEVTDLQGQTILSHDDITKGLFDVNGKPIKGPLGKLVGLAMSTVGLPLKLAWGAAKLTGRYLKASYKAMGSAAKAIGGYAYNKTIGSAIGGARESVEKVKVANRMVTGIENILALLKERLPYSNKPKFGDSDGDGDRDGSREDILAQRANETDQDGNIIAPKEESKEKGKGIIGLIMAAVGALGSGFAMIKNSFTKIFGFGRKISTVISVLRAIAAGKALSGGVGGDLPTRRRRGRNSPGGRGRVSAMLSKLGGNKGKALAAGLALGGGAYMMSGANAGEEGEEYDDYDYADPEAAAAASEDPEVQSEKPDPMADDANKSWLDKLRDHKGTGSLTDKAFGAASWIPGVGAITDAVSGRDRGLVDYAFDAVAAKALISTGGRLALGQGLRMAGTAALTGLAAVVGAPVLVGAAVVAGAVAGGIYLYRKGKKDQETALATFRMAQYGFNYKKESHAAPILALEKLALENVKVTQGRASLTDLPLTKFLEIFKVSKDNGKDIKKMATWFLYRFKPIFLGAVTVLHEMKGSTKLLDVDTILTKEEKAQFLQRTHITETENNPYAVSASPYPKQENVKYDMGDVTDAFEKAVKIVGKMKEVPKDSTDPKDVEGESKDSEVKETSWLKNTTDAIKSFASSAWDGIKSASKLIPGVGGLIGIGASISQNSGAIKDGVGDFGKDAMDMGSSVWDRLKHAVGASSNQGTGEKAMISAAKEAGITNANELALLLANTAHESGNFRSTSENLNYSASRLMKMWPKRFTNRAYAEQVAAGGPQAIANAVYGGRMGNNSNGDGWKYRGRGYIQLTGKANYEAFKKATGIDVVSNPDLLTDPDMAAKSAVHFWMSKHGLRQAGQQGDIAKTTKLINGGTNGLEDRRKKFYTYAMQIKQGSLGVSAGNDAPQATAAVQNKAPNVSNTTSNIGAAQGQNNNVPFMLSHIPRASGSNSLMTRMNKGVPQTLTTGISSPSSSTGIAPMLTGQIDKNHRAVKAATHATKNAKPKSIGLCARYVANALAAAGYKFVRQGSAWMYSGNVLQNAGFSKINGNTYQIGDIMVWPAHGGAGGGGKHGHIQIFNGKNWVSDFIQRNHVPGINYRSSTPTLWRDTTLLGKNFSGSVSGGSSPSAETANTQADSQAPATKIGSSAATTNPYSSMAGYENHGKALKALQSTSTSAQLASVGLDKASTDKVVSEGSGYDSRDVSKALSDKVTGVTGGVTNQSNTVSVRPGKSNDGLPKTAIGELLDDKNSITTAIVNQTRETNNIRLQEDFKRVENILSEQLTTLKSVDRNIAKVARLMERMEERERGSANNANQSPTPPQPTSKNVPTQNQRIGIATPIDAKVY